MTTYSAPPTKVGLVLQAGDVLEVLDQGLAYGTINNGGVVNVRPGGTVVGSMLDFAGGTAAIENVLGVSVDTTVNHGLENVVHGGTAIRATINNLGALWVAGLALDTTINDGGTLQIGSGTAHNVTFGGPGAVLSVVGAPTSLTGTIANWQVGNVLQYWNTTITGVHESNGTLTVTFAGHTASYTLAGQQAHTTFELQPTSNGTNVILAPIQPQLHDDAYLASPGLSLVIAVDHGLLANDTAPSPSTVAVSALPLHGALALNADGSFVYSPAAGFTGIDRFAYRIPAANGAGDEAQVAIHVVPASAGSGPTLDLVGLTAEEQVAATYVAFLGRAADAAGFDYWLEALATGHDPAARLAALAGGFAASAEARALHPLLADAPADAGESEIAGFLDSVYDTLFGRPCDAAGREHWTGEIEAALQSGHLVGPVVVDIMSGARDTADTQDATTLMAKVAVGLAFVRAQQEHHTPWAGYSDNAAATSLLAAVTADPLSILTGIKAADLLVGDPA